MDDTDRMIAGIYAATMTARLNVAKVSDFWTFYDTCEKAILEREVKSKAAAAHTAEKPRRNCKA